MLIDWFTVIGVTIGALLPIVNPFSTAPVFVAVTQGMSRQKRYQQARRASVYMCLVLLCTLALGVLVLEFFGISLPALRVAGGLVVARLGFSMLSPEPEAELPEERQEEALSMTDIAFTPIAMPLLSGPGSIAVTVSIATEAESWQQYLGGAVLLAGAALGESHRGLHGHDRCAGHDAPDGAAAGWCRRAVRGERLYRIADRRTCCAGHLPGVSGGIARPGRGG